MSGLEYLKQSPIPVDQHVSRTCPHEKLDARDQMGIQFLKRRHIVVRSPKEEAIINCLLFASSWSRTSCVPCCKENTAAVIVQSPCAGDAEGRTKGLGAFPADGSMIVFGMRRYLVIFMMTFLPVMAKAQFNVDRLMISGEIALHYEDYVLSIQYFNRVISLKPFLYQPWQYRGVAKFYLDDYVGAEADATEAIKLNPYIDDIFDLRAICRIKQKNYTGAIEDYNKAIALKPMAQNYWFNRAICRMNNKEYKVAHAEIDTINRKWANFAQAYALNAEVYLQEKDTVKAAKCLDKSLELDPYDADTWTTRAYMSLARHQWKDADKFLSKALHLKPKNVNNYVNRALARINLNNNSSRE